MRRFKRRGTGLTKIDELSPEHFGLRKTTRHGFPDSPSALSYDPETGFMAIGRKNGELRIYGRPGVEYRAMPEVESCITQIHTFGGLHQYITVHEDNSVLLWQLGEEGGSNALKVVNKFQLDQEGGGKKITVCCLAKLSGHFFIGTDGGNVYTLDVRLFELKDNDKILWEKATGLLTSGSKDHPGGVVSLVVCPSNQNRLLIGYEKGCVVLWNVGSTSPERNFTVTGAESLVSLSWQLNGEKFVSAHSDSSIYFWSVSSSNPVEGPTKHYGEVCAPIKKISWMNSEDSPAIIFSGGLPYEDTDDHKTVTVLQGNEHVALDFTSEVVDYITIIDSFTKRVQSLVVLCEQEIMAFDLEAPKCPQITKPCLYSIHASPVTCLKVYDNAPKDLLQDLTEITVSNPSSSPSEYISTSIWPITGGSVRLSDPPTADILITGHANGSVKVWDVTGTSMHLVLELKTAPIFSTSDPDEGDADMFSEFTWPPYRKVSSYDPFEDDWRLSIKFLEFCPYTRKLCIGGEGGQVVSFALNPNQADVRVASVRAEIFMEDSSSRHSGGGSRLRGLRDSSPLGTKSDFITMPAGFQPSFCVQLIPATPITALAFRPSWGLIAAANSKGFCIANFYTKSLILIHPTVLSDGMEPRNISKVQSMRRSLRSSLRRRATIASANEERRKIIQSLNLEMGIQSSGGVKSPKKSSGEKRSQSADVGTVMDNMNVPAVPSGGVPPEQRGHVTHLAFAETHVSGDGVSVGILASTMGSTVIRYSIEVPKNEKKYSEPNRALPAGKDYSLVHAAPIVAVFVLDNDTQSLPSPAEVEHRVAPAPNMSSPHYAVLVTQEQIKVVSLPSMKSKRKEKFHDLVHERIFKAWIIKVKVPAAPIGVARDWNNALCILTTIGHLLVYSLPDLKLTFHRDMYVSPSDQKALQSISISQSGEMFHLCSFSEIERGLLCSYNFSYHTSLMPSISSIHTPQQPPKSKQQPRQVLADVNPNVVTSPKRVKSVDSHSSGGSSQNITSPEQRSIRSDSVRKSPGVASIEADKKKLPRQTSSSTATPSHGQIPSTDSKPSTDHNTTLLSPKDKELLASASAFTQVLKSRSPSLTSSSSSSDSESESDDTDDDTTGDRVGGGETFGNPAAMADFGETKELDNIIASSLQQLESARAFYAQMQEKARSKPT